MTVAIALMIALLLLFTWYFISTDALTACCKYGLPCNMMSLNHLGGCGAIRYIAWLERLTTAHEEKMKAKLLAEMLKKHLEASITGNASKFVCNTTTPGMFSGSTTKEETSTLDELVELAKKQLVDRDTELRHPTFQKTGSDGSDTMKIWEAIAVGAAAVRGTGESPHAEAHGESEQLVDLTSYRPPAFVQSPGGMAPWQHPMASAKLGISPAVLSGSS